MKFVHAVTLVLTQGLGTIQASSPPDDDLIPDAGMSSAPPADLPDDDYSGQEGLISLGQRCVFWGAISPSATDRLVVQRRGGFLLGSEATLHEFVSAFASIPEHDRFILSSVRGVGYRLSGPPAVGLPVFETSGACQSIDFCIAPLLPRSEYRMQLVELTEDGDLPPQGPALIQGGRAAFQAFVDHLRMQEGDWHFDRNFGSRCAKYVNALCSDRYLAESMLGLEAIRVAFAARRSADFVSRICSVQLLDRRDDVIRLKIIVELQGHGRHVGFATVNVRQADRP